MKLFKHILCLKHPVEFGLKSFRFLGTSHILIFPITGFAITDVMYFSTKWGFFKTDIEQHLRKHKKCAVILQHTLEEHRCK